MQTSKDSLGNDPSFVKFAWSVVKVGDFLANPLMRSFLIVIMGIFPDNSRQMPTMKGFRSSRKD